MERTPYRNPGPTISKKNRYVYHVDRFGDFKEIPKWLKQLRKDLQYSWTVERLDRVLVPGDIEVFRNSRKVVLVGPCALPKSLGWPILACRFIMGLIIFNGLLCFQKPARKPEEALDRFPFFFSSATYSRARDEPIWLVPKSHSPQATYIPKPMRIFSATRLGGAG